MLEPATSPTVPPRTDRAVRAELEQLQARLRALQGELAVEHAAGYVERRAALERDVAQAVAAERTDEAQVATLRARERQLETRIAVAKAELAQLAQRQLSPALPLVALVGAYALVDAVAPRVGELPLSLIGFCVGAPAWFVFGLLFSLRVGGAAVTQPFPRVPSVLLQTVVFNPAAWAMPVLVVGLVAQLLVGSRLSAFSPARLVEHGWTQWPALLVVGLGCWGFRSRHGAQRVLSVVVGALAWGGLVVASMKGLIVAQDSVPLLLAVALPVFVASTLVFLTFLGVRTARAAWLVPAGLSLLASAVLLTNGPSFDESDLPVSNQVLAWAEQQGVVSPSFITAREANLLHLRDPSRWPAQREVKGAGDASGTFCLPSRSSADSSKALATTAALLKTVQRAQYRDLAAFLCALQFGLACALGALLFTADERRAVLWRLLALGPLAVLALVSWSRS